MIILDREYLQRFCKQWVSPLPKAGWCEVLKWLDGERKRYEKGGWEEVSEESGWKEGAVEGESMLGIWGKSLGPAALVAVPQCQWCQFFTFNI